MNGPESTAMRQALSILFGLVSPTDGMRRGTIEGSSFVSMADDGLLSHVC